MDPKTKDYSFLVADDHKIITQSLSFIIKSIFKDSKIEQVNKLGEVMKSLLANSFHMIILDISFPDGNTLQIIPTIRNLYPDLKILIFSGQEEELYALRYLNAGADGFVSKLATEDIIQNAILSVVNTGKYISPIIQQKITDTFFNKCSKNPLEQLSDRELEIANFMVEGFTNTQISERLSLQKSTVSTYKNRIFEKLTITNLSDLIALFQLHN